ncbi:hypothetical protein ACUZYJ_000262 [Campylobacter jejuni]|uniref:hypothetical protein n=1 Tax=Campylobacter TaxID=194 RepID=UPI000258074F|nr:MULTISPECIES: hypothetical protein [Campylobacter]TEY10465.1 hypothetical protein ELQ17_01915 [Campylobacter sp. US18a]ALW01261.1 hypothetical protein RC37_02605 [Campylobacter jejuni]ALW17635.1 hypothetical protein RB99_04845 [Campylobacter jejuni]ALW66533.1 hypothetical protein RB96_02665 [Campylobacter jejuni]EAH7777789.1 hypothetical protein [Campylobacter coli]
MNYDEFENKLKSISLSKKDFSEMVKMSYTGVTNWRQTNSIPGWVNSWLINYEKAKVLDEISKSIKPFIK